MAEEKKNSSVGLGVDRYGLPVIDPTANVQALSEASNKRQDDLRHADIKRIDEQLAAMKVYFNDLIAAHDKRYEQRYEAQEKATDVALVAQKDAVREAFVAQKEAINAALASADRAVAKAEAAAERRFEAVNEFRAQLGDQQRTLMPRAEGESRLNALAEKIGVLEGFRTETLSRGVGTKEGWGQSASAVALVVSVLALLGMAIALLRNFSTAVTP